MKRTFYFQHDYGARNDPKLQDLLIEHGVAGIGIFWCIIEQMYEQEGRLPFKAFKSIAFALHVDSKIVESVVKDFELFDSDENFFWSNSVLVRLNKRKEISDRRKRAAQSRWKSKRLQQVENKDDANAEQEQCNVYPKKRKEKERKEYNKEISSNDDTKKCDKRISDHTSEGDKKTVQSYEQIRKMWNSTCTSLPKVATLSEARKRKIKLRLSEMGSGGADSMAKLQEVLTRIQQSAFLRGNGNTKWRASFDWLFDNDKNWLKVLEGNYDDREASGGRLSSNSNINDEWL